MRGSIPALATVNPLGGPRESPSTSSSAAPVGAPTAPDSDYVYSLGAEPLPGSLHFRIPGWLGSVGVSCLIDSGATCNLVSEQIRLLAGLPLVPGPESRLLQADGTPLPVTSYCELQIALEGYGPWVAKAVVAPLLSCQVILGCLFLVQNNGILSFSPVMRLDIPLPGSSRRVTLQARLGSQPRPMVASVAPDEVGVAPPFEILLSPAEKAARALAVAAASFDSFDALLPKIESAPLRSVVASFKEVFPDKLYRCPPPDRTTRNHTIELIPGAVLPQCKGYDVPKALESVMDAKIKELVASYVLRRAEGNPRAVSPGFLVNSGRKPRFVGDYRRLNDATVLRAQDIPTVQSRLDLLARAVWFTLMDCITGFHQQKIRVEDQDLTTLATACGRFSYNVTAMGLKNAPTDFQRAVEAPLRSTGGFDLWVFNYLDDLLVFTATEDEHSVRLREVLTALNIDLWLISAEKIQVGVRRIHLLGHWVQGGAVHPDPDYIKKVYDLPSPDVLPNKIKGLQCLLGLFGYYRRFIPDFSSLAAPLTRLLRKDTPWTWGPTEELSRKILSERLQDAIDKGLQLFRNGLPIRISTDASGAGLGAVLEQETEPNIWCPVAFHSFALSPVEARLLNYERELLAIFSACRKWLPYLIGVHFVVRCDCAVLRNISTMSLSGRRRRVVSMLLFLRTLFFTWVHVPGKENVPADAFSRLHEQVLLDDSELLSGLPGEPSGPGAETLHPSLDDDTEEFVASIFDGDIPEEDFSSLCEMLLSIHDGSSLPPLDNPPAFCPSSGPNRSYNEFVAFVGDCRLGFDDALPWDEYSSLEFMRLEEPGPEDHCSSLFPGESNATGSESVVSSVWDVFPLGDLVTPVAPAVPAAAAVDPDDNPNWSYLSDPAFASIWTRSALGPVNKYRRDQSGKLLLLKDYIVVPSGSVKTVLSELHVSRGHVAKEGLLRLVTDRGFWWPRRHADVMAFVRDCPTCRLKSLSKGIIFGSPGGRDVLDKGQEIAVDFTHVDIPKVAIYDAVLGIVDRTSRYTVWVPASTSWRTSDFIRAIVSSWVAHFGLPRIIRSDNGPTFVSEEWKTFWGKAGCIVSHCAPYHPEGNGIVERSFRTLKSRLRALQRDDPYTSWVDMLPYVQGASNSLSRSALGGLSPSEAMFGFAPRWECLPNISILPPSSRTKWLETNADREAHVLSRLRIALAQSAKDAKRHRARKHHPWSPKKGDLVLVKRSALAHAPSGSQLVMGFIGPVRVLSVLDHNVEIEWNAGSRHMAIGQLRPWGGTTAPRSQSTMEALWSLLAAARFDDNSHPAPNDPGLWPSPDIGSSDEEDAWAPAVPAPSAVPSGAPAPVLPDSVPVPGIVLPQGVRCDTLKVISSMVSRGSPLRTIFTGKTVDLRQDTWYWSGLAHWERDDWVFTTQVLMFFRRRKQYAKLSEKDWLSVVDGGLLEGFMEESLHSVSFCKDLSASWVYHDRVRKWPSSDTRDRWAGWLRRACAVHSLPCPVRDT